MAGIKKETSRYNEITYTASGVLEFVFNDTQPNVLQIQNIGTSNIYISTTPNVSSSVFDLQVASYGKNILVVPKGIKYIYIQSVGNSTVKINSFEADEIFSSDLDKTQETVFNTLSAVSVEVNNFPISERVATTPAIYNVTCTNADTEYSQALPTGCKKVAISIQAGVGTNNFRIAYVTGKVATPTAPYLKYNQDSEYAEDGIYLTGKTIYFASSLAGAVAQIIAWS